MVSSIQYSYEQNTIRAYKSISYKVTFAKSNTKTYAKVSMQNLDVTDVFSTIRLSMVFNSQLLLLKQKQGVIPGLW